MAGYIGAKSSVALYDSYTKAQTDGITGSNRRIVTITPPDNTDIVLTPEQYSADILVIATGGRTVAGNIIVPNSSRSWEVISISTQLETIKTALGTGVDVPAGQSRPVTCDGTNVDSPLDAYYDKADIAVANSAPIKVALNAGGDAPIYACRAWVNFNGTGTVAIRASGNVSSITDNGVGDYTVNFTTAMPDANYSAAPASGDSSSAIANSIARIKTQRQFNTNGCSIFTTTIGTGGVGVDHDSIWLQIFR